MNARKNRAKLGQSMLPFIVLALVMGAGWPGQASERSEISYGGWQQSYVQMMNEGNCTAALRILEAAQREGFHAAYGAEAFLAEKGNCVKKDMERAVKLHTIAAPFYMPSEIRLWATYEYGLLGEPHPEKAAYWAERAARHFIDQGRKEAEAEFAKVAGLQTPTGTVKKAFDEIFAIKEERPTAVEMRALQFRPTAKSEGDPQVACEWLNYLGESGHASAYVFLSYMLFDGGGVDQNVTAGIRMLRNAMRLRSSEAFVVGGRRLISGNVLKQDFSEAYRAFLMAKKLGRDVDPPLKFVRDMLSRHWQKFIEEDLATNPERLPLLAERQPEPMQPACSARVIALENSD